MDRTLLMFALVVTCYCFLEVSGQNPEVQIGLGRLQGTYESVQRGNDQYRVKNFLGIPFAKPPVGDLRFRKPVPVDSLGSNPYNASYYRPYCPHMIPGMDPYTAAENTEDEDCLYLNVFVPDSQSDSGTTHAVMVWIYGGGFIAGAASDYHSAMLAASGNVIVVTLNYRIGMLGFMSTMDDNAPGNYGMFDQVLAINWVHENIADFGGDPTRVTVFGESAGAMSASLQALYEWNYGKIQRIIAQSGTANNPFFDHTRDFLEASRAVATQLKCPTENSYQLVECLRTISWQELKTTIQYMAGLPESMSLVSIISPRLDGDFIKTDFRNLTHAYHSNGRSAIEFKQSLDMLLGANLYEGGEVIMYIAPEQDSETFTVTKETMPDFIAQLPYLDLVDGDLARPTVKVIAHEYTNWMDPYNPDELRLQFVKMVGDAGYVASTVETAGVHAAGSGGKGTYVYQFRPVPTFRVPFTPSWVTGASHGEEIGTLFGPAYPFLAQWEQQLSDRMVTYWSNFAKTGNPNEPRSVTHNWAAYNQSHQAYMALDEDKGENPVHLYFSARETHFWRQTIPVIQAELTSAKPGYCGGDVSGVAQLVASILAPVVATFVTLL